MTRGRPLSFDRTEALRKAMCVFWARGYEGTQIIDLIAAMGINPPSFYAAFKSKKDVFIEAVDMYISDIGSRSMRALLSGSSLRVSLRAMMESVIEIALSSESGGCLLVLGVVNQSIHNREAYDYLREARRETLGLIKKRIESAKSDGEISGLIDSEDLARHFLGITQTISFQARDGVPRENLLRLIEPALAALPS